MQIRDDVRIVAAGKAAPAMADAAARRLGSRIRSGLVIASTPASVPDGFELIVGGHPIPTVESERGGRRALSLAESLHPGERLLVLVSGGASALMAVPAEGLTLEDKRATTDRLLRAGADIHALNTVRKHLSAVKGGWPTHSNRSVVAKSLRRSWQRLSNCSRNHPSVSQSRSEVPT